MDAIVAILKQTEAINKIELYILNISKDFFLTDLKTQDTISTNFTIIGKAASRILSKFKTKYSTINWRETKDFRNKLIHNYFGINPETVWIIIQTEKPVLKLKLSDLLNDFNK